MNRNAQLVLEHRYLQKDAAGRVVETREQMFDRVASAVAAAEARYVGEHEAARLEGSFAAPCGAACSCRTRPRS